MLGWSVIYTHSLLNILLSYTIIYYHIQQKLSYTKNSKITHTFKNRIISQWLHSIIIQLNDFLNSILFAGSLLQTPSPKSNFKNIHFHQIQIQILDQIFIFNDQQNKLFNQYSTINYSGAGLQNTIIHSNEILLQIQHLKLKHFQHPIHIFLYKYNSQFFINCSSTSFHYTKNIYHIITNDMLHKQYTKLKFLGHGSFGKVYLLQNTQTAQKVVDKTIPLFNLTNQEQDKIFKEVEILKKLSHTNIIKFKQYFKEDHHLHILMEYAPHGDLSSFIQDQKKNGKQIPEHQIIDWFIQLCQGISYIHQNRIIHRDLKAQNIFIGENNTLKIGDFGVSTVLGNTNQKAKTTIGSLYNMSPEILNNEEYTQKVDIWSLGTILYQLITLKLPFQGNSIPSLALKITEGKYQSFGKPVSRYLRQMIQSMLQIQPIRRPWASDILKSKQLTARIIQKQRHKLKQQQQYLQQLRRDLVLKKVKDNLQINRTGNTNLDKNQRQNKRTPQNSNSDQEVDNRLLQDSKLRVHQNKINDPKCDAKQEFQRRHCNQHQIKIKQQESEPEQDIISKLKKSRQINKSITKEPNSSTLKYSQRRNSTKQNTLKIQRAFIEVPIRVDSEATTKYSIPLHLDLDSVSKLSEQGLLLGEHIIDQAILEGYRIKLENSLGLQKFMRFYRLVEEFQAHKKWDEAAKRLQRQDRMLFMDSYKQIKQLVEMQRNFNIN